MIKYNKKEKIISCIILHALGDTIGYNNSIWELGIRGDITTKIYEKINEYIHYGGINYIPLKGWKYSDDTILHIAIIKILLVENKNTNRFNDIFVKQLIKIYDTEFKDSKIRNPGIATLKSIELLKLGTKWNNMPFDKYSGGSGAAMRTLCFGLLFNNIDDIIKFSIDTSRVTHNNPTGYLGGFVSAYFVYLAINNTPINLWPFKLMEIAKSKKIDDYVNKNKESFDYNSSKISYFAKWDKYIKDKFNDKKELIEKKRSNINLVCRSQYYYDSFGFKESFFPGGSGDDSVIIAYDSLIDCDGKWEKLVFYSMLHSGDTDTTGCIAAGFYGAYYGYGDVPKDIINNIENIKYIKDISNKFLKLIYNE